MIHGRSQGWGTGWRALGDGGSRALLFFQNLAARHGKSLSGRRLCCGLVGGRAGGGTTQHITAREEKRILHQGLCNFWHALYITIQYRGANAEPCHVSSAYFRQLLLNDIPALPEVLQVHVYYVLMGQLLRERLLRGTKLELHVCVPWQWQGKPLFSPTSAPRRRREAYGRALHPPADQHPLGPGLHLIAPQE